MDEWWRRHDAAVMTEKNNSKLNCSPKMSKSVRNLKSKSSKQICVLAAVGRSEILHKAKGNLRGITKKATTLDYRRVGNCNAAEIKRGQGSARFTAQRGQAPS